MKVEAGSVVYGVELRFDYRGQIWKGTNRKLEAHGVRYCSRCQCVLAVEKFNSGQLICKDCFRCDPTRIRNTDETARRRNNNYATNRPLALAVLGGRCCACGSDDPLILELHHPKREGLQAKASNTEISNLLAQHKTTLDLRALLRGDAEAEETEIAKALNKVAPLCTGCHRTQQHKGGLGGNFHRVEGEIGFRYTKNQRRGKHGEQQRCT